MDVETISNVNSNYGSAEAVKTSAPKAEERVETGSASKAATESVSVTSQPMPIDAKGDAEQQGSGQQQKQKKHAPSENTVNETVKRANLKMEHTRCEYSYHKRTNRVSIKVIDRDTDKVIREIPPEQSLDMLEKMWELAGILVDEKR